MWKLIFDNVTKRGTGCNREPQDGEFAIDRHPSECAWFNAEPERYQYVDGEFSEVDKATLDAEAFVKAKAARQLANKEDCKAHILKKYPLEIQSSAALGLYAEADTAVMQDYIADHLEEENTVFDLLEATTTMEELDAVKKPVWPEV